MGKAKQPGKRVKRKRKPKRIIKDPGLLGLSQLAESVSYKPSPYHSQGHDGRLKRRKHPAASRCNRSWNIEKATNALRSAVREGCFSEDMINGFPSKVWHYDGENAYEAHLTNSISGEYHAFPIENREEWPIGFDEWTY